MQLASLGWNQRFAALFAPHASAGLAPGRILQQFNSIYTVATANGELRAQLSGHLRFALCANMSETSSPSTITVGRGRKSHFDKHRPDRPFFRRVGGFGA
jgi:hypothetical protein